MDIDKTTITKGKVATSGPHNISGTMVGYVHVGGKQVAQTRHHDTDGCVVSDLALIADAFNTFTATGLTPSELAEQRGELMEACKAFMSYHESDMSSVDCMLAYEHARSSIKSALTKATEQP